MYGDPFNLSPQLEKPRTLRWSTIASYLCQRFLEGRACGYQLSAANNVTHAGDHCIIGFACSEIGHCTGIQIDTIDERATMLCLGHPAFRTKMRVGLICRGGNIQREDHDSASSSSLASRRSAVSKPSVNQP